MRLGLATLAPTPPRNLDPLEDQVEHVFRVFAFHPLNDIARLRVLDHQKFWLFIVVQVLGIQASK